MKKSPDTVQQHGVLYNGIDDPEITEQEDRKKSLIGIATISAGIATAIVSKNANADESYGVGVELGEDVNWIQKEGCPTSWLNSSESAQLMPGYGSNRFKLVFSGAYYDNECNAGGAILAKELEIADASDGGVIIKGLGNASPLDSTLINQPVSSVIEVDRGDGRTARIKQYGDDKIFKDGELKWEYGKGDCWSIVSAIHPIFDNPKKIKVVTDSFWSDALSDFVGSAWRVNINEPDYCFAIQQSINDAWLKEGKDPYEAGLLKHIEDGTLSAPESDTLLLVGGKGGVYGAGPAFVKFDPVTQQYTHLQHNADGTYTPENPQKGEPEFPNITSYKKNSMDPQALLKVQTPSGKQVHLIITQGEKINWAGGYFDLRLYSVEELTDMTLKDINLILEEQDEYPDDDGDGKANHEDNCRWRANPDQVNTTADENGDACKADCKEGGWPGVDLTALQTNSSGLRVCQSELGYDFAFSFEDGSTIHSSMDVEIQNGKVILKPGQNVRFIHSWDPRTEQLPAPSISLPAGNSAKIKVLSAKNLDGSDGQMVFNHDGNSEYFNSASDWQDFGIITNGEIENASDIEIEVGNENPVPVAEPEVETVQAELTPNSAEETVIVAEQPSIAEKTIVAEVMPDAGSTPPDEPAQAESTAVEFAAEPVQADEGFSIAEMPQIVVEKPNAVEKTSIAEQPITVESMPDIFVGQPEADVQPNQTEIFSDTAHDEPGDGQNTPQETNEDTALNPQDTAEDTSSPQDIHKDAKAELKPDSKLSVDTPASSDTLNIIPQKDTMSDTDISKPAEKEEKGGNGNGGGCSMAFVLDKGHENLPYQKSDIDGANLLITASVLVRLYSLIRKKIAKV